MSRRNPNLPLQTSDGAHIYAYAYYVQLRTLACWRVPVLHGKLPRKLDATATVQEQGLYDLTLLLLIHPHRGPDELYHKLRQGSLQDLTEDAAWAKVLM